MTKVLNSLCFINYLLIYKIYLLKKQKKSIYSLDTKIENI